MKESITLYFKDSKSDKVYQVFLEPKGALWVVNYANGRRGGTMAGGTKTDAPCDYETAKGIYDGVVKEKLRKGYQPGNDGAPFVNTSKEERITGILPQLLNKAKEEQLESLFTDSRIWMQPKFDGQRRLIKKEAGKSEISGINRKGLTVGLSGSVLEFAKRIAKKHDEFVLDGELIGDKFYCFDLLLLDGTDFRTKPYNERLKYLIYIIDEANDGVSFPIVWITTAKTTEQKRALFEKIKREKGEGVVFKISSALYSVGYTENQLKFKFVEMCSCVVNKRNTSKTKGAMRSVNLKMLEDGKWIDVGNCTIPANFEIPSVGNVVEIKYLYANKGGSIYQPVFCGVRDDVNESECTTSQLKYKPVDSDDDDA